MITKFKPTFPDFTVVNIIILLLIITCFLWKKASREENYAFFKSYIAYLFGALVTVFLIAEFPIATIVKSFKKIGWGIMYVFATAIPWFLLLGISLYNMFDSSVHYIKVCYIQFVGEGFNTMIPSGGVVGEIIKIQKCSKETTIERAAIAVLFDRLSHINSSTVMAASAVHLSVILIPVDEGLKQTLLVLSIAFYIISIGFFIIAFSTVLEKVIIATLKRLKLSENTTVTVSKKQRKKFLLSLSYRTLGRIIGVFEYYVILLLLNISPSETLLLAITAGISISASTFFMVPQGLGVNEVGVAGAFSILGMDPAVGVSIALIRRARIVFWGICGVSTYGLDFFISKKFKSDLANTKKIEE